MIPFNANYTYLKCLIVILFSWRQKDNMSDSIEYDG